MSQPVFILAWQTLFWLLPCFTLWYWFGDIHTSLAVMIVKDLVEPSFPMNVSMWARGSSLVSEMLFSTGLTNGDGHPILASARVEIDVLAHGTGLPLFVAMMLGTPDASGRDLSIPVGAGILLVAEIVLVYGFVALDFIRVLDSIGADTHALFGLSWQPQVHSVALIVGKLVLPTLLAIALWVFFNRRFLEENLKFPK